MANARDTAPCRLAQATALLLGTLSAGANLTLSAFLVPRLLESPTPLMLRQWVRTYRRGAATVPFAAGLAAAAYTYLYYLGTRGGGSGGGGAASASALLRARAYLAAGALTIGIVPYTLAVMAGTNSELKRMERAVGEVAGADAAEGPAGEEEVVVVEEESAKRLVDWWGVLNLGRGVLLLAGSICGLAATL
ncbi:DUF1772-domain-containing protein [Thermothelomyces heterothallicus CBS 203.75]